MEQKFAGRSRKELKNKFKREEKNDPFRVDQALKTRLPPDPEPLADADDDEGPAAAETPASADAPQEWRSVVASLTVSRLSYRLGIFPLWNGSKIDHASGRMLNFFSETPASADVPQEWRSVSQA